MNAETTSSPVKQEPAKQGQANSLGWLFSIVGALVVALILVIVNFLAQRSQAQLDFTEKNIHTLSDGTRKLLEELKAGDTPVTLKLFVTPDEELPSPNYLVQLREVRGMIDLFRNYAGKNLRLEIRRPVPDSDDEDAAKAAGVEPQQTPPAGEQVYFGLAASSDAVEKSSTIAFLPAIESQLLEYKLIRTIYRVLPTSRKIVGMMTPLELDGGMSMMGGSPPSYFYRELSEDYDVVKVDVTTKEIKRDEYTEYKMNYADGTFERQEYKNGTAGTKGKGTFLQEGGEAGKDAKGVNGGKAPEKLENVSYILAEGGAQTRVQFTSATAGQSMASGKTEGFAYSVANKEDAKLDLKLSRGVDILIVLHPAGITDEAQWAIDQYLMKGGKVLALLDAHNLQAAQQQGGRNPFQRQPSSGPEPSSSLAKLLPTWGYSFENAKVVADAKFKSAKFGGNPMAVQPTKEGISQSSVATKGLSDIVFAFSGSFSGRAAGDLKEEILIETSNKNQLMDPQVRPEDLRGWDERFVSTDQRRILAVKVTGKFRTAFPNGKPDAPPPPPPGGGGGPGGNPFGGGGLPFGPGGDPGTAGQPAPAAAPEATPAPAPATPAPAAPTPAAPAPTSPTPTAPTPAAPVPAPVVIPEAPAAPTPAAPAPAPTLTPTPAVPTPTPGVTAPVPVTPPAPAAPPPNPNPSIQVGESEGTVYLIGDSDVALDLVNGTANGAAQPQTGNIAFLFNAIDDLAGNADLIEARSRTSSERPFSRLNEILEETTKGIREEQKKVDEDIKKWQEEITTKTSQKDLQRGFIMIDQKQLAELQEKVEEGEAKKRDLRKEFRKTVDRKFTTYQFWNILGVPLFIALIGITVWIVKRIRLAAH